MAVPALGASGPGSAWSANGASACEKLLTSQLLSTILVHADGKSEAKPDGENCIFSGSSVVSI
jgi:hypothetical protein